MDYKNNLVKPLLFMVFNRPEKTKLVWEQICKAKPCKLYISADGPRPHVPDDKLKCERVREIVSTVNWDCDVQYLMHDRNLGCSFAGKTAFDWVFSQQQEMIELEDDTVPAQSFFWFVQDILEKYNHSENVAYITGQNFMGINSGHASYFFSRYGGSSGWATWKRVYSQWDFKLDELNQIIDLEKFKNNFDSISEYKFWRRKFINYYRNGGNTYDLQSVFLVFKNDMLNIVPNYNLITNIGFDNEGTNYSGGFEKFANKPRFDLNEITYPKEVQRDKAIDKRIFKYHFQPRTELDYRLRLILGPISKKYFPRRR